MIKKNENNSNAYYDRFFENILSLWVLSEIEKRQQEGKLEKPFNLAATRIVFFSDGTAPKILLNKEAKLKAKAKLVKGISVKPGDSIYPDEIYNFEDLLVSQDDHPDSSYVAFVRFKGRWFLKFDSRYNKSLSKKHILASTQFLQAAEYSLQKQNWLAFLDNLFSATELIAKAILLTVPDKKLKQQATHKLIHFRFNEHVGLGNTPPKYRDVFNRLGSLRIKARYLKSDVSVSDNDAELFLKTVKDMWDFSSNYISENGSRELFVKMKSR